MPHSACSQHVDNTQRLQVVLKSPCVFISVNASCPAWPNGVCPRSCASRIASTEVFVEPQAARHRARDLRNLETVGERVRNRIAFVIDEDLVLYSRRAKCGGVNKMRVARRCNSRASHGRRFAPAPAAAVVGPNRVARQLRHRDGCREHRGERRPGDHFRGEQRGTDARSRMSAFLPPSTFLSHPHQLPGNGSTPRSGAVNRQPARSSNAARRATSGALIKPRCCDRRAASSVRHCFPVQPGAVPNPFRSHGRNVWPRLRRRAAC